MNVLVTGATGTVGSHVVRELHERGVAVRAFVRDRAKAERMIGDAVELAVGAFGDHDAVAQAMRGVDRLFLACGNVPGQVEHESAAIDAAARAGVSRIVKLSGPRADIASPLLFERWHGEIERHLLAAGVPSVRLRPSAYMSNLLAFAETIGQTGTLFAPAGAARIAYVDPRDVAACAAIALVDDGHEGQTYTLTGPEAITYERIARELSAATAAPVTYVDVPDAVARQAMLDAGLPPMIAESIVDVFASQRAGSMERTTGTVQALTGRAPRGFAQFARDHAAAFAVTMPTAAFSSGVASQ
jgi:uncharacterized protein YbjT (DUF2867 family)